MKCVVQGCDNEARDDEAIDVCIAHDTRFDDDDEEGGCFDPALCVNPHIDHCASECATVETMEDLTKGDR